MVMNPGWKIGLIREDIGRAKQESMAMIPRIFRVNLESMAMNPGIFSIENQESMAMSRRIFRANLESMAMNPGIFSMENLESMAMNPGGKIGLIREEIGLAKQESMAMIPRIFRVNLESMAINPGIFSMENLESMVMNPGGKIGLISLAFSMVNLESMVMNLSILDREILDPEILDREILDPEILDREIGRAKQESMAMIPGIIRASLESMALIWDGLTMANNGHQRRPL